MIRPYSPATDATPRDSDLDPHAGCREREAALRRALAAADAMAASAINEDDDRPCRFCYGALHHSRACPVAAYQAARKEVTP